MNVICEGPNVKNSCKSCEYWHQGYGVSHNHCDHPMSREWYSMRRRANGYEDKRRICHFHIKKGKYNQ